MPSSYPCRFAALAATALLLIFGARAGAQSVGNSGSVTGTVFDPSRAVVPNASVKIPNPVNGYDRSASTDNAGRFTFSNFPFNPRTGEQWAVP